MDKELTMVPHGADMRVLWGTEQIGMVKRAPQRAAYTLSDALTKLTGLSEGYAVKSPSEFRPILEKALEGRGPFDIPSAERLRCLSVPLSGGKALQWRGPSSRFAEERELVKRLKARGLYAA